MCHPARRVHHNQNLVYNFRTLHGKHATRNAMILFLDSARDTFIGVDIGPVMDCRKKSWKT